MNEGFVKNTMKRLGSALIALPLYVYAVVTNDLKNLPILILCMIVTLASLYEFYKISKRKNGGRAFVLPGIIGGAFVCMAMYFIAFGKAYGFSSYFPVMDARLVLLIISATIMIVLTAQIFFRPIANGTYSTGVTLFGIVYIVLFFSHVMLIKAMTGGWYYVLILNIVIMLNDTGAYFGGLLFGKHKTGFPVSPNKSWEGYFSGLLFSIAGMIVAGKAFSIMAGYELFSLTESAFLGIILSILGDIGDLVESAFKRDGEIKDSGSIIPGHGGMWDVFDAMIFSMPFFYFYLVLKGIH